MRYEIGGYEALLTRLNELGAKGFKRAVRRAARAGCKVIRARVLQLVPVDTGLLRSAIRVRAVPRSRRWFGAQVKVPVARTPTYYGGFVELGTKKMRGRRFMRDALDQTHTQAAAAFTAKIQEVLDAL